MARTTGKIEKQIFKKGSTAYYWNGRLFPAKYRDDIFALYSFVNTADNYVDEQPPQPKKLLRLEKSWQKAIADPTFEVIAHSWDDDDERAIKHIVRLTHKYKFDQTWVQAFFDAMKQDIDNQGYANIDESLKYVYGSAEVVGLMVARIIGLPPEADEAVQAQARAMQWVNHIRDISEDSAIGRIYFPRNDLRKYNLKDLSPQTAFEQKSDMERFIKFQLKRYYKWQIQAEPAIEHTPRRLQSVLKTAIEMYKWTAKKIEKNPMIVYDKKVKPKKIRMLWTGTKRITHKAAKLLAAQETPAVKKPKR